VNIETEMLISILRLTKDGPVSHEVLNKEPRVPASVGRELLQRLQTDGLIYFRGETVEANSAQRIRLAVRALKSGADPEKVSSHLQWKEFEGIARVAFETNGYTVIRNLHFRNSDRRWEMDIVGCRGSLVVCLDCKHWHHGLHGSTAQRIAKEQAERTRALVRSLPNPALKIDCLSRTGAKFVPAVLSLTVDRLKLHNGVPIVPVLQLQDFLDRLPAHTDSLLCLTPDNLKSTSSLGTHVADRVNRLEGPDPKQEKHVMKTEESAS
jgi:Holliday junction resolvase-like predicted endonuclease